MKSVVFTSDGVLSDDSENAHSRNGGTDFSSVRRSFSILISLSHDEDPPAYDCQDPTHRYSFKKTLSVPPLKLKTLVNFLT